MNKIPVQLEIAICTFGNEGLRRFAMTDPPRVAGISYTVHLQIPDPDTSPQIPDEIAHRDDIAISLHRTQGIAVNRNHAIDESNAPVILITDDDLKFASDAFAHIIEDFRSHSDSDIIAYQVHCPDAPKYYPSCEFTINRSKIPKNYFCTASEIALRPERVRGKLRFNEYFGFNTLFRGGEDDIFLADAVKNGFIWTFIPRTIAIHPESSTGRKPDPHYSLVSTKGAVTAYMHPILWPLRMIVRAFKETRKGNIRGYSSIPRYIKEWIRGVIRARKNNVFPTLNRKKHTLTQ